MTEYVYFWHQSNWVDLPTNHFDLAVLHRENPLTCPFDSVYITGNYEDEDNVIESCVLNLLGFPGVLCGRGSTS